MSSGKRRQQQSKRLRERRISIRAIQRDAVDIPKLSRVLIAMVQAEAETKARAEHKAAESDEPEIPRD